MPKFEVYVTITVDVGSAEDAGVLVQSSLENMLTEGADIDSFTVDAVVENN